MSVLFFAMPAEVPPDRTIPLAPGHRVELWHPSLREVRPAGMPGVAAVAWWALHHLRVFANREYGQLVIRDASGALVHRAGVFPRWLRFPFMSDADLQVGDTWTDPASRGKQLAGVAIQEIAARVARPGRTLWYLTTADNIASIRAAERAGFRLRGRGARVARFGVRALGAFTLDEPAPGASFPSDSHRALS